MTDSKFKSIGEGYVNASGRFIDAEYVQLHRYLSKGDEDVACYRCAHWHGEELDNKCDAFPNGIPEEIFYGGIRHDVPYPNADEHIDKGLTFSLTKD